MALTTGTELVFCAWMGSTAVSLFGSWRALQKIARQLERLEKQQRW